MYADDIVLVSISIEDTQSLVKDCINYLTEELDLPVNFRNCNFLRVWPRFDSKPMFSAISFNTINFNLVNEARYLGIFTVSGKKFACNYRTARK